jgi:predicted DCC family thiol-disulfide oxidoreductase YuxK
MVIQSRAAAVLMSVSRLPMESLMTESSPVSVYYDGACPVCTREIETYRRLARSGEVRWVDVSSCAVGDLGDGLDRTEALGRFHLRDGAGRLVSGVDAFIALWARLPGFGLLARLASLPPARMVLGLGYRGFLRVRPLWRR